MFNLVHIFIPHCGVIKIFDHLATSTKKASPNRNKGPISKTKYMPYFQELIPTKHYVGKLCTMGGLILFA